MIETKFKDSELGPIPEDWEVKSVKDFSNIVTGATPSTDNPNYWGGNIRWMSSGELNNKIIYDVIGRITQDGYNSASTHMLPVDCVLIGLAGQGKTRGTAAINKVPLCTNQSIGAILPCNTVNPHYLYHFIDNQYLNLRALSSGDGGRGGLSKTLLLNFKIILPLHISEQERIAEALSDVDALIKELDALIEKKRMVLKATMQDLLTARRRLPGFSEPWQEVKLGDVSTIFRGGSPRPIEKYLTQSVNGYNWIKIGDVKIGEKYITKTQERIIPQGINYTRLVNPGDFILSNSMSFGRPYILKICGCIHDGWLAISEYSNYFDTEYLYYLLGSDLTYKQYCTLAAGSGVLNLNKALVSCIILRAPRNLSEQRAIAEVLSDIDSEIAELEKKKEKYTSIRQGMMQQLLTGKIRLI